MRKFLGRLALLLIPVSLGLMPGAILPGGILSGDLHAATRELPPPPTSYVTDEVGVLKPQTIQALQTLFKVQDAQTHVQIVFVVFQSLAGEDPVIWTNRIFQSWKIGKAGEDNGILLALYWKDRKARIEVGYGLEPKLTDAKSKRILAEFLAPQLKLGNPDAALVQTALEILKVIDSPLLQSGEAERILKEAPTHTRSVPSQPKQQGSLIWILFAAAVFILIGRALFISRERHFERSRWKPRRPFSFRRRGQGPSPWDESFPGPRHDRDSGFFPPSQDDTDFRGGGGKSGGGGASQDW